MAILRKKHFLSPCLGTEIRISTVQDEAISTPAGLKKVLQDPYLCQQYVIDGDIETTTQAAIYKSVPKKDKFGNLMLSPVGGKRRIDWILYRDDGSVVRLLLLVKRWLDLRNVYDTTSL